MDKSNRVTFKASADVQRILKDLRLFYGQTTRSKLLQELVSEAVVAIYRNPMPKKLSAVQKRAYKRIVKMASILDGLGKVLMRLQIKREKAQSKTKKSRKCKQELNY